MTIQGIPIVECEIAGLDRPFCRLMDNCELDAEFNTVKLRGVHILCNKAGLDLLKEQAELRNMVIA